MSTGHFGFAEPPGHPDWLCSGSNLDRVRFDSMLGRIGEGMLSGEAADG
ncbi:MAG: hypothetical protein JRG92_15655 [Deltaproteobacteria bacterium]|nr:hypothetical protein [Deltaproteobacteria bacterium]MBW2385067.1 hypothetical protein [Deltaproteobacteria bacterium]MBW2698851.1 hypothetical protein [Deltaproteobacteria bacterium]